MRCAVGARSRLPLHRGAEWVSHIPFAHIPTPHYLYNIYNKEDNKMSEFFKIDPRLEALAERALADCEKPFARIAEIERYNSEKVLRA